MFSDSKVKCIFAFVLFVTVFSQTLCHQHSHGGHGGNSVHGGSSSSKHKQDHHGNYEFNYDIKDHKGATNFRKEKGSVGHDKHITVEGTYGLKDVDGRMRVVHYTADKNGYRVKIKSNEPGVSEKNSAADAIYSGEHGAH